MRFFIYIITFTTLFLNSCIEHKVSSSENDDVYFIKKDIIPIEEEEDVEIQEVTGVEEVK